jgi:hypothetical protein
MTVRQTQGGIMFKVIFTLDYEIHGNGAGCPRSLMVEPTSRLLKLFEKYGAKLTIMADVAEIIKFREYRDEFGKDDYCYEMIAAQLRDAIRRGHDVQLHLHCSYFNARFEGGKWKQDWSEYNFARLSEQRLKEVVRIGKEFLEEQLQPIHPKYSCNVFRAANWAVSPSRNVVRALVSNGFQIETSVFKYGRREGIVSFDYSNAPSNLVPWMAAENDICLKDEKSSLLEVPIYAERRWIGAFITPQRIHRAWLTLRNRVSDESGNGDIGPAKVGRKRRVDSLIQVLRERHAWKADFNQCSGKQLIRALERAATVHNVKGESLPFVLIGHSKLLTRYNEHSLEPFLRHVAQNPARFEFGTFTMPAAA